MNLAMLQQINIYVYENTVDGGYPSYKNIATAKHRYRTDLFYKPQQNWVHNPLGDLESINYRYQQYWKHHDFNVYADIEYKLCYLYQQEDYEWVGAYYRNQQVQTYNCRMKYCTRRYRIERNTNESFNNYLKQHMGFKSRPLHFYIFNRRKIREALTIWLGSVVIILLPDILVVCIHGISSLLP